MTITFKPTGTTNYILSEFNNKTADRILYEEGAVPLHKIISYLYDFLYTYKNIGTNNKLYYLHAILKPEGDSRPQTPVLMKLEGKKKKAERIDEYNSNIDELINDIDTIFADFISSSGRLKSSYRTDSNPQQLVLCYKEWNTVIKDKIKNLCS